MDKDKLPLIIGLVVVALGILMFAIKRSQGPQFEPDTNPAPAQQGAAPEPGVGPGATGVQGR